MTPIAHVQPGLPEGFRSEWASSVGVEDGFALQLLRGDERLAEIYRDDLKQGALSLRTEGAVHVPIAAVKWLLNTAEREMPPYMPDEDRGLDSSTPLR